jgi:hypothetical protein
MCAGVAAQLAQAPGLWLKHDELTLVHRESSATLPQPCNSCGVPTTRESSRPELGKLRDH